ncbi:hypothetical protein [Clostridium weizhouense]|uniref:Small, acid-soluble spore protein, alpha/beta type n=1 Tax=Clostridium weizhouense TaxID=2859781 RepID=A0ABS7ATW4_9CLOT|nr:hypothetical protein [Clostridium weizhouense]MBW6410985.1 hypothetical protein [Clostridium weizhouense]
MGKNKKEKLIQQSNDNGMSQTKVKSYEERNQENINKVVSRGKDITINQL